MCAANAAARRFDTNDALYDLAWSEINENQLIVACGDGSLKLFDLGVNDFPVMNFHEHKRETFSVCWSPITKDTFLSSSWDGTVKIVGSLIHPEEAFQANMLASGLPRATIPSRRCPSATAHTAPPSAPPIRPSSPPYPPTRTSGSSTSAHRPRQSTTSWLRYPSTRPAHNPAHNPASSAPARRLRF